YPFWYAQVLGVYHVNVSVQQDGELTKPTRMEFLWVRWFGRDPNWRSGWRYKRLDRIGFVPHQDSLAFGFLDPQVVIRAAHLIPAFAHGRTQDLCPPSMARDDDGDWEYYYVNRYVLDFGFFFIHSFVDRDMLIRHLGGGVGH
ncbi:hypothetical protein M422DRAFT_92631, partial [Sphaerobolus stellatus SS14]